MAFPQHFLPSNALDENGHWSVGLQSAVYHDAADVSFIAGIDTEYTEGYLREFQSRPQIFSYTQGLHYDYEVRAINASGFVQAEYQLAPRTTLTGAIRVDGAFYDYDNLTDNGVVGRFLRLPDQRDSFVTTSPKFSILHELSKSLSAYASYAHGTRPPQTTDLYRLQVNQTGDQARPEKIDSGEAGLRIAIEENLSLNIAGYWMAKRNFFFRDADGFNVANGKTRHAGIEADLTFRISDSLQLQSAVAYAAHTYRFDRMTGQATESMSFGDDVDSAPRFIGNTRLRWKPVEKIQLEGEWVSVGSYFTDAANDHAYEGHDLLHLRGEFVLSENLAAFVTLRNITDALYAERADFAFGSDRYFPGEERTFGIGLPGAVMMAATKSFMTRE